MLKMAAVVVTYGVVVVVTVVAVVTGPVVVVTERDRTNLLQENRIVRYCQHIVMILTFWTDRLGQTVLPFITLFTSFGQITPWF